MRYLIMAIVYILLASPTVVLAQDVPLPNEKCQRSDFSIMGKKNGTDFLYKMGEVLKIRVTGGCAAIVEKQWDSNVFLFLDDVKMTGLPMSRPQFTDKGLIIPFQLTRNSENEPNRSAWNTLLTKQRGDGYIMTFPVAIAIGSSPAWSIPNPNPSPFQFYIVDETKANWIIAICLAIFFGAYYLLVQNPSALREEKGGHYSLGKSQMAFWGLLVALSFAGIWFLTGTTEYIPDQVLILIGISGATGLSAMMIAKNKRSANNLEIETKKKNLRNEQKVLEALKENETDTFKASKGHLVEIKEEIDKLSQQPASAQSAGFWHDICDNGNGISFHRLQVVIWTMILGVVFIDSVSKVMSMPEFSNTLLMLMGISSGTYLGFKIPEKNANK